MIVCSCNVLTDSAIRTACVNAKPRSPGQVYGCLGCSAQCGRCARTIRKIMDEALSASSPCPVACGCCPAAQHETSAVAVLAAELADLQTV